MDLTQRLLAAQALDRIIYGDDHVFAADDARYLRRNVPIGRRPWFALKAKGSAPGSSVTGYSPGIGNVEAGREEDRKFEYSSAREQVWRCGQYKLIHERKALEIWAVMSDEFDEDPRGARLEYNVLGEPVRLLAFRPRMLELPIPFVGTLAIGLSGWVVWKTPTEQPAEVA